MLVLGSQSEGLLIKCKEWKRYVTLKEKNKTFRSMRTWDTEQEAA